MQNEYLKQVSQFLSLSLKVRLSPNANGFKACAFADMMVKTTMFLAVAFDC